MYQLTTITYTRNDVPEMDTVTCSFEYAKTQMKSLLPLKLHNTQESYSYPNGAANECIMRVATRIS